ncbi:MAG: hypothetical protein K9J37_16705 [Saprospiraceae bacterium]|nr:hypothetical protein [Saprospiraceae bacterium]MCF8251556.1 hypothetical protein [Saprospiraceae bacterium]MCF8280886.1 hypothetical protein [Bacteroidales bacterium]MCF8310934.1 hypothetical protein [Saprospiraceae bacterium]MCF8439730.1 hypothetical protein [Saprospiraceae bacterium]
MKNKSIIALAVFTAIVFIAQLSTTNEYTHHPEFGDASAYHPIGICAAYAYPPTVGVLTNSKNCISCHVSNGPWMDESKIVIDILDKETKQSLKQPDGSFLIETNRWAQKTVLTVIGSMKGESVPVPYRNAWLYIDPTSIGTNSLSKFASGWDVNLPMSCRVVGDNLPGFEHANITNLPMTIQPMTNANNAEMQLQVMLTMGESLKGNAQDGMLGNYFERKVKLVVKEN